MLNLPQQLHPELRFACWILNFFDIGWNTFIKHRWNGMEITGSKTLLKFFAAFLAKWSYKSDHLMFQNNLSQNQAPNINIIYVILIVVKSWIVKNTLSWKSSIKSRVWKWNYIKIFIENILSAKRFRAQIIIYYKYIIIKIPPLVVTHIFTLFDRSLNLHLNFFKYFLFLSFYPIAFAI